MHRTWIAVAVAAVALASASVALAWPRSSQPGGDPARFLSGVIRQLVANRYGEAWQTLAPHDQALAPEQVYVACESRSPVPGRLTSLRVLGMHRDRTGIAVRFALRIAGTPVPQGVRVVLTAHAVDSDGRWAWILPPGRRALYRTGCRLAVPTSA